MKRSNLSAPIAATLFLAAVATSAGATTGLGGGASPAAGAAAQSDSIGWQPCRPETGVADTGAECARITLPVDHAAPDGPVLEVAVGRMLRSGAPTAGRTQLWYLPGGPGDSGIEALGRLAEVFAEMDVDLYTLDPRGVAGTVALRCLDQEIVDSAEGTEITAEEWPECIAGLRESRDDLDWLTTDASARDLAAAIETLRQPGDRVVLFGASYGTYWANRVLRLFPGQPDAVILDGIVPPDWSFAEFDAALDQTGRRVLEACIRSSECAEHLGPDPVAVAEALPGKFADGHCPDLGADSHTVRLILGNMLMAGREIWPYIPATIRRLDRCRVRDLQAVGALVENLFESGGAGRESDTHSPVLQRHVSMSELWPPDATDPATFEAALERTIMTTAISSSFARTYADWPRYPRPADWGEFADYRGPLLLLHGGLDPTMPVTRLDALREHFSGANQQFVLFPHGGHVVLNEGQCAREIYAQFIADPAAAVDASCVDALPEISLSAPETDTPLFGTEDFWGDRATSLEIWLNILSVALGVGIAVVVVWSARFVRRRLQRRRETRP